MATIVVTNLNDSGAGSLREAVTQANASVGVADTIQFQAGLTGTLTLTTGDLDITDDLTIDGDTTGDNKADIIISGNNASRIFHAVGFGVDVDLLSLTLTNGKAGDSGGAVYTTVGTTLDIVDSTISNSSAAFFGGGIRAGGTLTVINSTISGNIASYGGGVEVQDSQSATFINTTIHGNHATNDGGGIDTFGNTKITITSSTITDNSAGYRGGGVNLFDGSKATVTNSVIAQNTAVESVPDIVGTGNIVSTLTAGNSFFGTTVFINVDNGGNINNGGDPLLGALADNGGTVQTRNILSGSALINSGNNAAAAGIATDANGNNRIDAGTVDIGATEFQSTLVVTTASDIVDANDGLLSLREAVTLANANVDANTIIFDASLKGKAITLGGTELALTKDITIDGDTDGDSKADITISGNDASRIFTISANNTSLLSLTLTNGFAENELGGAIRVVGAAGSVYITDTTVTNSGAYSGGGIHITDADVTLTNSLVSNNSLVDNYGRGAGGGIYIYGPSVSLQVVQSTIHGNETTFGFGGGIYATGGADVAIVQSTVTGNTSNASNAGYANSGGGIALANGASLSLANSVVADNHTNGGTLADDISGAVGTADHSLIGTVETILTNLGGVINGGGDPGLGALQDNGGTVQTRNIQAGSVLINAGGFTTLTTDANGNDRQVAGAVDMGATEFQLVVTTELDVVNASDGLLSLREAITLANANADADSISFDASLAGKTIVLTGGELAITTDLTIDGDMNGDDKADITISGNNASRVFSIFSDKGSVDNVDLLSLTLTDGSADYGGAIFAFEVGAYGGRGLTIADTTISNSVANHGGGVHVYLSVLNLVNSLLSGNAAGGYGGGLFLAGSSAMAVNATFYGNSSGSNGGGIFVDNGALLTLQNSTISGNEAATGGGIENSFSTVTVINSVVAGNSAVIGPPDVLGAVNTAGNSFFGTTVSITTDNGGNINTGGDPLLGELLDNGGTVLTMSPLDGSPLIGKGSNVFLPFDVFDVDGDGDTTEILPLDGRGGVRILLGTVDIGAVEQFPAETIRGTAGNNTIVGGLGADILFGLEGDDTVTGGSGNDYVEGGAGADNLDGGTGAFDMLSYAGSALGVNLNLATNSASGGDAAGDIILGFENATGSNKVDTLVGSTVSNLLQGLAGNDVIDGGDGDDTIIGGLGGDTLAGAAGIDTLSYVGSAGVTINLATGEASGGHATGDIISGFENINGSNGKDTLTGNAQANLIRGNDGADTIRGGAGADNLNGGKGFDTLSYAGSSAGVSINLALNTASGGDADGDVIFGFENLLGSAQADTLTGSNLANAINGGGGADRIDGGNAIDTLTGSAGADTFVLASLKSHRDVITDFGVGADKIEINAAAFGGGLVAGALDPNAFVLGTTAIGLEDRFIYNIGTGQLFYDSNGLEAGGSRLIATFSNLTVLDAGDFVIV